MLYKIGRIGKKERIEILIRKHISNLVALEYWFQLIEALLIK